MIGITTNAGKSWQAGTLPSGAPSLTSVACADTQHCVAVGQSTMLVTSDGGATWTDKAVPVPSGWILYAVACNPIGDCIAVGGSQNGGNPAGALILRSADKGATWATENGSAAPYGLSAIACPSDQFCAATGGFLAVSNDGGQTWVSRAVNGGMQAIQSISCINPLHCIAVGANPGLMYNPSAPAQGISTTDGGNTWNSITLDSGSGTTQSISCPQTGACMAGGPPAGAPASFETLDPNGTWTSAPTPGGMSDIAGLDCHVPGICIAVGHIGNQPATATSTNGGTNWTTTLVPYS